MDTELLILRLKERIEAIGTNANRLALDLGYDRSFLIDLFNGRKKSMNSKALNDFAEALDSDAAYLLGNQDVPRLAPTESTAASRAHTVVQLIGSIGHDQSGLVRPLGKTMFTDMDIPLGMTGRWEAVVVDGSELIPAYRPGSVLLYRPTMHDLPPLIGHECIVELVDGRRFVRFLYPEKKALGRWSLESDFNQRIANQEIRWASPIRLVQVWRTKPVGQPTESESH